MPESDQLLESDQPDATVTPMNSEENQAARSGLVNRWTGWSPEGFKRLVSGLAVGGLIIGLSVYLSITKATNDSLENAKKEAPEIGEQIAVGIDRGARKLKIAEESGRRAGLGFELWLEEIIENNPKTFYSAEIFFNQDFNDDDVVGRPPKQPKTDTTATTTSTSLG